MAETVVKTYRFALRPSAEKRVLLAQHAGASRFVWNLGKAHLDGLRAAAKEAENKKWYPGFYGMSAWFGASRLEKSGRFCLLL